MKKYFYHTVTERPMFLNQVIEFNENNHSGVYERIYKEKESVDKIYDKEDIELTNDIEKALREFALEEVREKEYPEYPSRLSCLYVSNSLEEAEFWYNTFITQGRPTFQLVKVEVEGRSFTGDAWNCFHGTKDIEKNYTLARKYWNNEKNERGEKPIVETLVDGKIKIVEIIKVNEKDMEEYEKQRKK